MEPTFPWEFYVLMVIMAIATVAIWEFGRRSCTTRLARLQVLRDQARGEDLNVPLSRGELEEMQCLLDIDPGALDLDQAGRLLHLRGRFGARPNPRRARPAPVQRAAPIVSASAASSSTQVPAPLPRPLGVDVATQTTQPQFKYLEPQPVPTIQLREVIPEGPYYQVPGRDHVHLHRDCWGLRNASRVHQMMMCRCCIQGDGASLYGPTAGERGRRLG